MTIATVQSRVGADGILHLELPIGEAEANHEVEVIIKKLPPKLTQEEWRAFVEKYAGIVKDPLFLRPEQPLTDERECFVD
jgi:hypothetical protein